MGVIELLSSDKLHIQLDTKTKVIRIRQRELGKDDVYIVITSYDFLRVSNTLVDQALNTLRDEVNGDLESSKASSGQQNQGNSSQG